MDRTTANQGRAAARDLMSVLAAVLPTAVQTQLLRACIFEGEDAQMAWHQWCTAVGDPKAAFANQWRSCRLLLPLLQRRRCDGSANIQSYLRGAALYEEQRYETYRSACAEALSALHAAGISFIVSKGAALAETAYPTPTARHSHDVDVLVDKADLPKAVDCLVAAGFRRLSGAPNDPLHRSVAHVCGLPVLLHRSLYSVGYYGLEFSDLAARSKARLLSGVPAQVLASSDQLVHILGQAFCSSPRTHLLWACDAMFLLQQSPDLSWPGFVDSVARSHLALPVVILLRYLVDELKAPVPAGVPTQLLALVTDSSSELDCELALHLARRAVGLRALLRQSSAPRGWMVHRMALPSSAYAAAVGKRNEQPLLLWYVRRALGYLWHRMVVDRRTRVAA